jgi:pimeloyl-ACP methyl ester carboxylesterase/acyl carrier protein
VTPNPDNIIPPLVEFVSAEILHGEEDLDENTPLLALGVIDSLSMVSLLDFIQRTFHVVVPNDSVTVENFEDINAIADLVRERMGVDSVEAEDRSPMEQAVYVLEAAGVASTRHELPGGQTIHMLSVEGHKGPPWILLPGLGNPASSWGNMLKALDGEHPAAAIDLAGFGLSTGESKPHYRDHVQHLEELLDQRYSDTKVVLVGSSAGCLMVLEYARRHPERVHAVVLLGFGLIADPQAWMNELDELWKRPEEFLARTYHEPPRLNDLLLGQFKAVYAMDAYHSYLEPRDLDASIFDGIEAPTLVLGGSSDEIIGMDAIRSAAERMPSATLVELARCGHFPGSERPEETIYTIDNFLREKGL